MNINKGGKDMPNDSSKAELHGELFILLKRFHQICIENNIQYSLHGGTLLGAIREKGFIPWDDDADIAITRKQYQRLSKVFKEGDFGTELEFQDSLSQYPVVILHREGKPLVWLDILIYDYISERALCQQLKKAGLLFLAATVKTPSTIKIVKMKAADSYGRWKYICFYTAYLISRPIPMRWKLAFYHWFSQHAFVGHRTLIHRSNDQIIARKIILPVSVMQDYQTTPFESTDLMITRRFSDILISSYGSDYMIPKRDMNSHEQAHDLARMFMRRR